MPSNLRNAAIILMSLPNDEASRVMSKFDAKQVETISIEIAKLGRFSSHDQEEAILAFADANPQALGGSAGGLDAAKALLEKALGPDAAGTLAHVQQSIEAQPFGFLKQIDPQNLLTFINDEHPQTIALVVSHLAPAYGAQVIAGLAPEKQLAVVSRIANMGQTSPEIIEEVESALEARLSSLVSESFEHAGGIPSVAELLNVCDRTTERTLLENLAQDDPELVEEIRRLTFLFEDIGKLGYQDMQTVLKNAETGQWAMALKGASDDLKQKVLGNMSTRAAQMLEEEMDYLGSVRLSEVEAIQQQIVDIVRRLEETGEITVGGGSEGADEFIS
jgi:flagellar motor switch protein FliG